MRHNSSSSAVEVAQGASSRSYSKTSSLLKSKGVSGEFLSYVLLEITGELSKSRANWYRSKRRCIFKL